MSESRRCPQCGAELPAGAPDAPCPACLIKLGLESWADRAGDEPGQAAAATEATPGRFQPPDPKELAGHFPQLEILELLGVGGMGAVYKARQPGLDRLVAVKILPPEIGVDPEFAERFTREARALSKLSHQNIVSVFDFGQADGLYYFIMEYVDGANLRHVIETGAIQPEEALAIVPQICEALQFAHDENIVHRDIKPENILVDKQGRVKIADFGLAKLLGKAPGEITLTGTHQVMGTRHYMAPEQMQAAVSVDHRADIYSLGVVFYEMLTGNLPVGRFEPPSKKVQVDVRVDEVVLRSLEQEPERRYQQVSELKTDVESISGASFPRTEARLDSPELPGRIVWGILGMFLVGWLLMGGLWNLGWFGLALGAGSMAVILLSGLRWMLSYLPSLREALREKSRGCRIVQTTAALLLFTVGVGAIVRLHIDAAEYYQTKDTRQFFFQIPQGETAEARNVMRRLPVFKDRDAAEPAAGNLWIGSGGMKIRGALDIKRSFVASVIPLILVILSAGLLVRTPRYRHSWPYGRKPALILAFTCLLSVLAIAGVNIMRPDNSWNRGWPSVSCDAKFDNVSQAMDDWAASNGYELRGESHQEINRTGEHMKKVGKLRVMWLQQKSLFDRFRVTPHGVRRPKPPLVVTLVGNLEKPFQTHVTIEAGSYRTPSNEERDWAPVLDGLVKLLENTGEPVN